MTGGVLAAPMKGEIEKGGEPMTPVDRGEPSCCSMGDWSIRAPLASPPEGNRKAEGLKVRSPEGPAISCAPASAASTGVLRGDEAEVPKKLIPESCP